MDLCTFDPRQRFINNQSESTTLPKMIIKSEELLCLCSGVERIHMMASFTQHWQCLFVFFSSLNPHVCGRVWRHLGHFIKPRENTPALVSPASFPPTPHIVFFLSGQRNIKAFCVHPKYYVDIKLHDFLLSVEYKKRCLARCSCCSSTQ